MVTFKVLLLDANRLYFWIAWTPPLENVFKLNMDRAKKVSTEFSSVGSLIGDHHGTWVNGFMAGSGGVDSLLVDVWALKKVLVLVHEICR